MENKLQIKSDVGEKVIARLSSLSEAGFTMPKDFNYVNAVKMSMLKLQELKDKSGKSALDVCTPASISTALFKMCTKGLNAALNQCYFIVRGNQLCCDDSYFGKILMVKRIYPQWNPFPVVVREGDIFEYKIDPTNGKKSVVKHEQKMENIDKPFVGAYLYLPNGDLYIMTKKQILAAWSKSASTSQATHKLFDEKMVSKTIVNSGCNTIINSTPELREEYDPYFNGEDVDEQYNEESEVIEVKDEEVVEEKPKKRKAAKEVVKEVVVEEVKVEEAPKTEEAPKANDVIDDDLPFDNEPSDGGYSSDDDF